MPHPYRFDLPIRVPALLIALALAAPAAPAVLVAQDPPGHQDAAHHEDMMRQHARMMMEQHGQMMMGMPAAVLMHQDELELTPQQTDALESLHAETQREHMRVMERMHALHQELGGATNGGPFDEEAARAVADRAGEAHADLIVAVLRARHEVDQVLTPEQRRQLESLHEEHYGNGEAAPPEMRVPASMQLEHQGIHGALEEAMEAEGRVGESARELAALLGPHFEREEEIALPPLGLLEPLARGEFEPWMRDVLPMTDSLAMELPEMLEEHEDIAAAAARLEQVAREEGAAEVERLARELQLHAATEEEILYPAAILVGEIVRMREP